MEAELLLHLFSLQADLTRRDLQMRRVFLTDFYSSNEKQMQRDLF